MCNKVFLRANCKVLDQMEVPIGVTLKTYKVLMVDPRILKFGRKEVFIRHANEKLRKSLMYNSMSFFHMIGIPYYDN